MDKTPKYVFSQEEMVYLRFLRFSPDFTIIPDNIRLGDKRTADFEARFRGDGEMVTVFSHSQTLALQSLLRLLAPALPLSISQAYLDYVAVKEVDEDLLAFLRETENER